MATEKSIAFWKEKNVKCDGCGKETHSHNKRQYFENEDRMLCEQCVKKLENEETLKRIEEKTGVKYRIID